MRLIWILAVVLTAGAVAQTPEAMLGAALHQERVSGNLQAAIDGYRKVLAAKGVSRTVAAQAQYHIGICFEKLGDQEARKAFESVVKNYGDQRDFVIQARARLAAMSTSNVGEPQTRLVWDDALDFWGRVTADGRYLSHVDWATGDLAIRDLRSGTSRRVTNYGGFEKAQGEVESTSISPDGKRVVFNWGGWAPGFKERGNYQLRVIGADGTGERLLIDYAPNLYFEAQGWSPDGKWVALYEQTAKGPDQGATKVLLIAPETGERREIVASGSKSKSAITFSPDGKWLAFTEAAFAGARQRNVMVIAFQSGRGSAFKVAEDADLMGWTPTGDGLVIRRAEASGMQLYHLPLNGAKIAGEPKALHLPYKQEGVPLGLTPLGQLFYGTPNRKMEVSVQKLDLKLGLSNEVGSRFEASTSGFANNLGNVRFSPDGTQLATLNSRTSIRVRGIKGGSEKVLTFEAEIRRFEWLADGKSILAAAIEKDGRNTFARIDLASGGSTILCENRGVEAGRVFVPTAEGNAVLQMRTTGLLLTNLSDCSNRDLIAQDFGGLGPLNLRLSKNKQSLMVSSFASMVIYDIASGSLKEIYKRAGDSGDNIWGADWSEDGSHIVTIMKARQGADKRQEIRLFPLKGGETVRLPFTGVARDFDISPDGSLAAISREQSKSQVWVIENFLPAP